MFTRCPACHTVHPVNATLLAADGGKFRCGKCNKVSNALDSLFDQWPQASDKTRRQGSMPELGNALRRPANPDEAGAESEETLTDEEAAPSGPLTLARRIAVPVLWIGTGLVLAAVITFNLAEFLGKPLQENPAFQSALVALGMTDRPEENPNQDLDRIELISREMKPHPSRPGVLLLTATVVNRAEFTQPYPKVDITLLDIRGNRLARQLFSPGDYLTRSSDLRDGMATNAYLTFSIDMLDPGEQAVGFEMLFR